MLAGLAGRLEDFTFFNSRSIADLYGDDYPEVITGTGGYFVHAFDGCGDEPRAGRSSPTDGSSPTAAVGDVTGEGALDVVSATRDGWLYAWSTKGSDRRASSSGKLPPRQPNTGIDGAHAGSRRLQTRERAAELRAPRRAHAAAVRRERVHVRSRAHVRHPARRGSLQRSRLRGLSDTPPPAPERNHPLYVPLASRHTPPPSDLPE